MTAPQDALSGQIVVAGLRVAIERARAGAIRQLGERSVSLQNLKNIAGRQRDRIERITTHAGSLDAQGVDVEGQITQTIDEHHALLARLRSEGDDLRKLNSDMKAQLGNDVPTSGASQGAASDSSGPSGGSSGQGG